VLRDFLVVTSLWLASVCSIAAEVARPTPLAFGRTPAMESFALSPNGDLIAWIANGGGRPVLQALDLANNRQVKRIELPGRLKVRRLDWADDQILLIHAIVEPTPESDSSLGELFRTVAMEVATGKSRVLARTRGDSSYNLDARLLSLRTNKPHTVMTSSRGRSPETSDADALHMYEVDTLTGEATVAQLGTVSTHRWVVDADGQAVARSDFKERWKLFTAQHRRESGWAEIFRLETGEKPELLGLTRDRTALLMRARLSRKSVAIWRLYLKDPQLQLAISDDVDDLTQLVRDPYSQEVLGAWTNGLTPEIRWLDEQAEKRATSLRKTFGGKQVELIGRSADGVRALVGVGTHATPVTYYLVDFKRGTADIVGEQYPELVDVPLGEVRAFTFKARDGYEIPAYLTLPPGSQPTKLPLVVLPHDWPDSRDETKFDPVAQFLATRGYAVLQPQFRGSGGFGESHRKAGHRQWGGLMQNDVTDGVRAMIEQGIADPKRICIAGTAYGGYAALAGVAFTPELYACAISVNGMTDLPDLISHVGRQPWSGDAVVADLEETIGRRNSPDIADKSPARSASKVKAPVLLIHGVEAAFVPVEQSREMLKALGGQSPHELIELPGEASWKSDSETRVRVLTEMERFLAKHLPVL
jgi:dipeptidyl aminopeptidase/acylaminoacyl peptidase